MDEAWKATFWRQYGAAIDMLDHAIAACPDDVWGDRAAQPEFWYLAYHTLFFLDLYVNGTLKGFAPPAPFNMDEIDPAGVLPERVYTRQEMRTYLAHGRRKCRAAIEALTDERSAVLSDFDWLKLPYAELLLDNLRHVQHHTAQMHLILRQRTGAAPKWISTLKPDAPGE
jgi:hypothetical protein